MESGFFDAAANARTRQTASDAELKAAGLECCRHADAALAGNDLVEALRLYDRSLQIYGDIPRATAMIARLKRTVAEWKANGGSGGAKGAAAARSGGGGGGGGGGAPTASNSGIYVDQATGVAKYTVEDVAAVERVRRANNHYAVLQLDPKAPPEDIRKAYHRAARSLHPDKNNAPFAEEAFKALQEALEILKDEAKREAYDEFLRKGGSSQQFRGSKEHVAAVGEPGSIAIDEVPLLELWGLWRSERQVTTLIVLKVLCVKVFKALLPLITLWYLAFALLREVMHQMRGAAKTLFLIVLCVWSFLMYYYSGEFAMRLLVGFGVGLIILAVKANRQSNVLQGIGLFGLFYSALGWGLFSSLVCTVLLWSLVAVYAWPFLGSEDPLGKHGWQEGGEEEAETFDEFMENRKAEQEDGRKKKPPKKPSAKSQKAAARREAAAAKAASAGGKKRGGKGKKQ